MLLKVKFNNGKREYFGSLSAILEMYTEQEIGCRLYVLHNTAHLVAGGKPFVTPKCKIYKRTVYRKKQNK
ncbi:MAG: hypothetical protein IKU59_00995 [Bacteroidales bacterium]|nr:hypothetical protein [Bacteroidales bacterium]